MLRKLVAPACRWRGLSCGRFAAAVCLALVIVLAGSAAAAQPADVEGAATVQKIAQAKGTVRVIARLTTPAGATRLTGSALAAAQRNLAATMRAAGVTAVQPLGRFPF